MTGFFSDYRVAARTLLRDRGFTFVVVCTLMLGIGLSTTVIVILNAYFLRDLPYPAADRLYSVRFDANQREPDGMERLDWPSLSDVIEQPIAWDLDMFYVTGGDHPEAAPGAWITPGFLSGLGIRAELGRVFDATEFQPGNPQVALISDSFWRQRFGGDPSILGRAFRAYVSDRPNEAEVFRIVGVLPANFWHVNPYTQIFAPLRAATYPYMVRLRAGVPAADAERRISEFVHATVHLRSVHQEYVRSVTPILTSVATATGIVLLIACANAAFLILIRANRQQKDVAIRVALGAGRGRVTRMLVAESCLLCAASTLLGLISAAAILTAFAPLVQQHLGRQAPGGNSALSIDMSVLVIVGMLSVAAAGLLTLAPVIALGRRDLSGMMRRASRGGIDTAGGRRVRSGLIVLEIAGSLALLVGCALMVRTLVSEAGVDLGIRYDRVIGAGIALREQSYPDSPRRQVFYDELLQRLDRTAGIESAGLTDWPALAAPPKQPVEGTTSSIIGVSPDYFRTLGVPLKWGRLFTNSDRLDSEPVAVVSQTLAARLWPDRAAVGNPVRIMNDHGTSLIRTVVGVVGDVRQLPTDDDTADLYIPFLQSPSRFAMIYLRTTMPPASWEFELRQTLREIDPEVTLNTPTAVDEMASDQLDRPRFLASLMTAFAVLAMMLALIGLYGALAYSVRQREHEIAVRMAIGADRADVMRLFMREGAILISAGIAIGVFGAGAVGRMLATQLYSVAPVDLWTTAGVSCIIAAVCTAATWWPSRRAASTDPLIALREE
jgi:putative ABC transport system permease protein